ncbi:MAG: ABC transporter permease, partial [Flavobacteriales bacterium]
MVGYITRKLLYSVSVLFGIVTVVFLLFTALPGDPARLMLGQRADQSEVEMIRKDLGLDLPLSTQYFVYLNDLSPLSFYNHTDENSPYFFETSEHENSIVLSNGESSNVILKPPFLRRSYQSQQTVVAIVADALPGTAVLAVTAILIATILGVLFGIFGALYKGQWPDKLLMVFSIFGMSLPS